MSYDSAAWGALAVALSVLLGVVTFFRWRSRGLAAGVRGAAWTLLPVAAWLTGMLELTFDVGSAVGEWAVHVVFSPVVWLGIVLAGVSAALFGAAAVLGRRAEAPASGGAHPPEITAKPTRGRPRSGDAAIGDGDLDDIEAILRRHGIS